MRKVFVLASLNLILLVGHSQGEQMGEPFPEHVQVVMLKQILGNAQAYKNREVILKGNYGYYCCPSDFSYKEGLETVEVAPVGFDTPRAKPGRPVRIYGIVRLSEKRQEIEEEKEQEETEGSHVHIEAKGMEFK